MIRTDIWNPASIRRVGVVLLTSAMLCLAERDAFAETGPASVHALLDVPYVSQTPELCGGAAVAMVLRYWGDRNVFAQDFAPLIGAGDAGILTSALASSVRDRGWQALAVPVAGDTDHARIRSEIDQGRPIIALIEVGPRTYHYVVIVGSTDQEVVLHDPARAPFRVLPWVDFDRAWTATGRWAMLVMPPAGFRRSDAGDADDRGDARDVADRADRADRADDVARAGRAPFDLVVDTNVTPCALLVERSVHMALTGDPDGAEQGLIAATGLCPNDSASWRELAGLRFSQSRWSEAQDLALSAVRLAPDDAYAWQVVATSRYMMGDTLGALDAWNRTGEPRIDTIDIHGADRTRQPVVVRATGLQPRQVLTPEAFRLAQRRLHDLPVASSARIRYEPASSKDDGELTKVDVFIDERQVVPSGWPTLATLGARAVLLHELRANVAGALGAGELASASWRWSAGRPRVALSLALPSPVLPGVLSLDGSWERQSYDATPAATDVTLVREERRRVGVHLADWQTSWLHWQAGAALDRLREYDDLGENRFPMRRYLAVESTLGVRLAGDRLAVTASGGWWAPVVGDRFMTGGLQVAWRSTDDVTLPAWSAVSDFGIASRVAPLALWQGAGTGAGRSALLRAHPLLINTGVLTGPAFGRELAHGSLEYERPVVHTRAGGLSVAGFADTAQAWQRLSGLQPTPLYVDAGAGVRLHTGDSGGAIRIDIAHGLRGGGTTLSASWGGTWPR